MKGTKLTELKLLVLSCALGVSFSSWSKTTVKTKTLKKSAPVSAGILSLKETPAQIKVQSAYDLKMFNSPYISWGVLEEYKNSSINLRQAWSKFHKNKDVVVAVVDTGIDYQHVFLKDNIFLPRALAGQGHFGVDFSKGAKDKNRPEDNHGHGTHIAGVIKSVMPDVKILALKYYNPKASDSDNLKSTVEALEYAIDQNVDIINYSSGGRGASLDELKVLQKARDKGILVVAAAGNHSADIDNQNNAYYPASYGLDNIIAVINHDSEGKVGPSSNYGKTKADISAPGTRIKSSLPNARSGLLTGTSQATAFVSGVAALLRSQYPELGYQDLKSILVHSARFNSSLKDKCVAQGMLDASAALEEAKRVVEMKKLHNTILQNNKMAMGQ